MLSFIFFHRLLLSFNFIQVEPSLCFGSDQISNPSIHYVFFPVRLPQAEVIVLHKSTMMYICTSLKVLPSGSGFSFGDVKPFEVIFPLIHYGGSFFSLLSSLISAHEVPDEACHGLMSSEAASGELCLCAVAGSVSCFVEDRGQGKEAVLFLRVFHVCVS